MPRVLTCIDPSPQPDGQCLQTAWIEQGGLADMLPTMAEANIVGSAFFGTLILIAFVARTLKPPRNL
ncbi:MULTISPECIES: hypothetical protein [Luteimonas]|uniref:hypothetical protein n=1 Tax=Luteimonas TaxID=83614 RepID=UPI000C79F6CD|nr:MULTISPECIES: hypothetical protein [Luteimonas]